MAADDFFEEEADLAMKQGAGSEAQRAPKAKPRNASRPTVAQAPSAPKPPSFVTVVLIALVALVLGIGIGYFIAMAVVDRTSGGADQGSAAVEQQAPATTVDSGTSAAEMPSDHPDISSMINPDGSINEEAVAEYRAQRAAQQAQNSADGE